MQVAALLINIFKMAVRGVLKALQLYVILRFLVVLSSTINSSSVDLNHQRSPCERFYGLKCRFGHEILAKLTRSSNLEEANGRKTRVMLGRTTLSLNKYLFDIFLLLSNDVNLNSGPNSLILRSGAATGKRNNLRISTFNVRSIVNKRLDLQPHVAIGNLKKTLLKKMALFQLEIYLNHHQDNYNN